MRGNVPIILKDRRPDSVMVGKGKPSFHASHHVAAVTFLLIGIIITTSMLFAFTLVLNQNHNTALVICNYITNSLTTEHTLTLSFLTIF
jgi:hypothetical protein